MELKPNMYVRTKKGNIGKITFISPLDNLINLDTENYSIGKHFISKASYNIIDLIEVGDYVNGYKVLDIKTGLTKNNSKILRLDRYAKIDIFEEDIKSIVTKEQFSQMEYKVGE